MNIFLDIETIPDQREGALQKFLDNVTAPGQYKKADSIEKWIAENGPAAAEEQYHKTSLQGIAGEIASIAWAIDDGEIDGHIRLPGESEGALLDAFFEDLTAALPKLTGNTWVGFNILEFDLRFILQRCMVTNTRPPIVLPADARHGSTVFDCMKAWTGWKGYVSQDALCEAFGIKGKSGMDGSQVWSAYQDGRYEDILDYNKDDVRIVRELYRRMSWG